ncbi:MAG TPA: hypothetical protein PK098_06620 [Phycisphaerales bacterium]|nr:hypothetical protein [Phycisphaerales bacterium]
MLIKQITIEADRGTGGTDDIEILRIERGALVTCGNRIVCEVREDEPREARFEKACEVAKLVYGTDRKGRANATNSMIHDVLNEIERVAGC